MLPVNRCANCTHPDLRTPKTFPEGRRVLYYLTRHRHMPVTVVGNEQPGWLLVRLENGAVRAVDSRHCVEVENPPLARDHPYGMRQPARARA